MEFASPVTLIAKLAVEGLLQIVSLARTPQTKQLFPPILKIKFPAYAQILLFLILMEFVFHVILPVALARVHSYVYLAKQKTIIKSQQTACVYLVL
jgi:hypothetical protein